MKDTGKKKMANRTGLTCSKGQMFIVAAVFMLTGLVLMFNLLGTPLITEEEKFQETRVVDSNARNIADEFLYISGAATIGNPKTDASIYLKGFSDFVRQDTDSGVLYAFVYVNGSSQAYSIEVGNYLGERINFTINVTNSSPTSNATLLADKSASRSEFVALTNGTVNIMISYAYANDRIVEEFPVTVSQRNFARSFFDVYVRDGDFMVRIKDTYNRTW